jgi:serine/threonine-protein kinase
LASRFVIERDLGSSNGGPTRSYLARDEQQGRRLILKILHPSLASLLEVERFDLEIAITGRLRHPFIVPLLDSGQSDGIPWFAMPDIGGETLRERLTREEIIPAREALSLVGDLAHALDHAHRHGVVHRDVTPENIVLSEGHAFITNLGIARALDAAAGARLTETGALVGTSAYMSPEQAAGEVPIDGRSDVYALGCILYEMLSGEPLHTGPTPQAIIAKRKIDPTPRLLNHGAIPAPIQTPLLRALAIGPANRFPSAADFGAALSQVNLDLVRPDDIPRQLVRVTVILVLLGVLVILGWVMMMMS